MSHDTKADGESWVDAFALDELPVGEARVLRHKLHHVAVFRAAHEELYALDSRCPREGLPLAAGSLAAGHVACAFHAHRFDLRTGRSDDADEAVRMYPVRVRAGRVEVSLAERSAEAVFEQHVKSMKVALQEGRLSRAAHDLVSMLSRGIEPARIAIEIAAFDAQHNREGAGHAVALCTDALRIASRLDAQLAALPLVHAADLASEVNRHRAARKVPASQDPGRDADGVGQKLLQLCEASAGEQADGLLRGALWRKWGREVIEPWFYELNAARFWGAGQGLILCVKSFDLLEAAGFEHARKLLPGVAHAIAALPATDAAPDWQWFRQRYALLEPRLADLWARQGQGALDDVRRLDMVRMVLDRSPDEAWHAVIGALASGARIDSLIDVLSRAASERLWRFDSAFDLDSTVYEGWGQVAEALLYVHALREAARCYRKPGLIRMLLFAVRQINGLKPLDLAAERWLVADTKGRASFMDRERLIEDLEYMVRDRQPVEAQRAALAYLGAGGRIETLRAVLEQLVMRDLYVSPQRTALALQLVVAACDEAMLLPEGERGWPLRALIRMLASPTRERSVEALAQDAVRLVLAGQPRRRLTSPIS